MNRKEQKRERAYEKLRAKYGLNIPEQVDHYYGHHHDTSIVKEPGFVVWEGCLYELKPVMDVDLTHMLRFDEQLREQLRNTKLADFCERYIIPLHWERRPQ